MPPSRAICDSTSATGRPSPIVVAQRHHLALDLDAQRRVDVVERPFDQLEAFEIGADRQLPCGFAMPCAYARSGFAQFRTSELQRRGRCGLQRGGILRQIGLHGGEVGAALSGSLRARSSPGS
jgi:hypothetical protein